MSTETWSSVVGLAISQLAYISSHMFMGHTTKADTRLRCGFLPSTRRHMVAAAAAAAGGGVRV